MQSFYGDNINLKTKIVKYLLKISSKATLVCNCDICLSRSFIYVSGNKWGKGVNSEFCFINIIPHSWLQNFLKFLNLDKFVRTSSVHTFFANNWKCTSIYRPLSYTISSLVLCEG